MLRLVHVSNAIPYSVPVSPNAEFEAGMIMGLTVENNLVCCCPSNGFSIFGIVDDCRTKSFSRPSIAETHTVPAIGVPGPNGQLVTPVDIKVELENPNVAPASFISIPVRVQLIPKNGVIIFPAGTPLNYDLLGTGVPNAIKTSCSYNSFISNIPGDSSVEGGYATIWVNRGIFLTDKFETNQVYPLNANLFVNEVGILTTRQIADNSPGVAIVVSPPTAVNAWLGIMWL